MRIRLYHRFLAFLAVMLLLPGLVFAEQPNVDRAATAQPAETAPADTSEPAVTDTDVTEPTDTEPVVTDSDVPEPTETEPVVTDTDVPEPTETEPVETDPPGPPEPHDEAHVNYVNGLNDGSFRPNKSLSRAEMAQIIYNLGSYEDGEASFEDVPENAWYTQAVNALASAGIIEGYEDGLCHPLNPVTRAQFVTVLSRLAGISETDYAPSFPDVPATFWGYQAIAIAQEQGWVDGYPDGSFQPKRSVTRAEAVTMLNRYLQRVPDEEAIDNCENLRFFPDVRPGKWYYYGVMEAAIPHLAHIEYDPLRETWLSSEPVDDPILDGFYCINDNLYVAENGALVHQEQEGVCDGVSYSCTGEDGICTVSGVNVLKLFNGNLVLIEEGVPLYSPGSYPEGFYAVNNTLFASKNGFLLRAAVTETVNGYTVICSGPNGPCRVEAEVLVLVSGEIVFLVNSYLQAMPGFYADGFHVKDGGIYVVEDGFVVHTAKSGTVSGVSYTCEGSSGKCTVSGTILTAVDGSKYLVSGSRAYTTPGLHDLTSALYCVKSDGTVLLSGSYNGLYFGSNGKYTSGNSTIDSYIQSIVASSTNSSMSQQQRLRACYNYVRNNVHYRSSNSDHVPQGADDSTWVEKFMLRLINQNGYGNCYCYAAEMYYLARRLGYWQAKGISGAVIYASYDHSWLEMTLNGTTYLFDPQLESTRNLASGKLYMKTYAEAKNLGYEYFKK